MNLKNQTGHESPLSQEAMSKAKAISDSQSVRTTFRMSKQAFEAKDRIAKRYGITQKAVIDQVAGFLEWMLPQLHIGTDLQQETKEDAQSAQPIRRTHVISRSTARRLDILVRSYGLSRDRLLQGGLIFFEERLQSAEQQRKEACASIRERVGRLGRDAEGTAEEAARLLGRDDPISTRCQEISLHIQNLERYIEEELSGRAHRK